jgi:hypothetical protein
LDAAVTAMKTTRKRRTRHAQSADAALTPAPRHASGARLPLQAQPVIRGVMRDPFDAAIGASDSNCVQQCLAACRAVGGPPQSACESLCATVCNA